MKTAKERFERFLSDTPIKPVARLKIDGTEVFVADGYITPEMYLGAEVKFVAQIDRQKHPNGCYATVWMAEDRPVSPCGVGYFETTHDVESVGLNSRQTARVNSVMVQAKEDLRKWRGRNRH